MVGVTEVAARASITEKNRAYLITNWKETDLDRDPDHAIDGVRDAKANAVTLNLPGPGGYNVATATRCHEEQERVGPSVGSRSGRTKLGAP